MQTNRVKHGQTNRVEWSDPKGYFPIQIQTNRVDLFVFYR
jgi:hypothetical protein